MRNRNTQRALKRHDFFVKENQATNIKQRYGSPGGCIYLTTEAAAIQNLYNVEGVKKGANKIQWPNL